MNPRPPAWWLGAIAPCVAVAVHARTLGFDFTELDDRDLVVDDHAFLARPSSLLHAFGRAYMHVVDRGHAYYRPLVTDSYALDALWSGASGVSGVSGANPAGYHATNVALHAVVTGLVFALFRRFALPPGVALAAALVFAVHPTLAAAVAWIPGRNDSLLAVFALAAWIFFLRDRSRSSRWDKALHFAFFGLALLTKETAIALPLVWIAETVVVDRPRDLRSNAMAYVVGWAVLGAALVLLHRAFAPGGIGASSGALVANVPVLVSSLGKLVFPFAPTVLSVQGDLSAWPGVIAAVALGASALVVPGVRARVVVFGLATFVALLAPVLAVPGTLVLDNRLYLPAVGVLLALGEIARAAAFEGTPPVEARLFVALSVVLAAVLGAVTLGYEGAYRNRGTFAREAVDGSPHSPLAHFCLGQAYQIAGDPERALAEYTTSLSLGPGEIVHNNIAVLYMAGARWSDAERELREELALNPRYARAYENLAVVLRREGRDDESREASATARALEAP